MLRAGTEDERDNVLGRVLNERAPILAFSQRSRREREADPSGAPGRWKDDDGAGAPMAPAGRWWRAAGVVGRPAVGFRGALAGRRGEGGWRPGRGARGPRRGVVVGRRRSPQDRRSNSRTPWRSGGVSGSWLRPRQVRFPGRSRFGRTLHDAIDRGSMVVRSRLRAL